MDVHASDRNPDPHIPGYPDHHGPLPYGLTQGEGFSEGIRGYRLASGRAVPFEEPEEWLKLDFGIGR